jgi:hypothetical protein
MFCKACGKKVDDDSKYCIYCGAKLLSNDEPKTGNNEKIKEDSDTSKIESKNDLQSTGINNIPDKKQTSSSKTNDSIGRSVTQEISNALNNPRNKNQQNPINKRETEQLPNPLKSINKMEDNADKDNRRQRGVRR